MVCSVCGQESFEFQFTPLREGRPQVQREWGDAKYFNSRPCERGDADIAAIKADKVTISIHAPARGATQLRKLDAQFWEEFQFTPLREGRPPR